MRTHGTRSTYCAGCRCAPCTAANTAHSERRRRRIGIRTRAETRTGRTHGRRATYNTGCRCAPCTAAMTDYIREHRRAKRAETRGDHAR